MRTVCDAQGMDEQASFGWLGADREGTLPKVGEVLQRKAKCQCEFSYSPGWFEWLMTVEEFAESRSHDGSQLRFWQHLLPKFFCARAHLATCQGFTQGTDCAIFFSHSGRSSSEGSQVGESVGVVRRNSGTEVETIRKARVKGAEKRLVKLEAERVSEKACVWKPRSQFQCCDHLQHISHILWTDTAATPNIFTCTVISQLFVQSSHVLPLAQVIKGCPSQNIHTSFSARHVPCFYALHTKHLHSVLSFSGSSILNPLRRSTTSSRWRFSGTTTSCRL